MRLYHATTPENVAAIQREGFNASSMSGIEGVFFSDEPAHYGEAVLAIEVPDDRVEEWEVIWEDDDGQEAFGHGFREFLIPLDALAGFAVELVNPE